MLPIEVGKLNGRYVVYWYESDDAEDDQNTNGNKSERRRRRFRLKARTKEEAKAEAARVYESQMVLKGEKLTFRDIWKIYEHYLDGRVTAKHLKNAWKFVGPELRHYHPNQINDQVVTDYVKKRKADYIEKHGRPPSDSLLYNEVHLIQGVLNHAFSKKKIKQAPIRLQKPTRPKARDRWLRLDEIRKLLSATEDTRHLHVAVVLMLSTAGRIGAILELSWDRVDMKTRTIDLRVSENPSEVGLSEGRESSVESEAPSIASQHRKQRAFVPINDGLFNLLAEWRQHCDSKWVVEYRGTRVESIYNAFRKAAKRAGLKGVTPHVLRHTAAVHMVASGCEMAKVSQYLGHSSVAVTERIYARFAPEHMVKESKAVDFLGK